MPQTQRCLICIFFVGSLLFVVGCQKVPKPSADSTPPILSWHVENRNTGKIIEITGSADYAAKPGDALRITLTADDPQGIQKITLRGGFTVECRDPRGPYAQNLIGYYTPSEQVLVPDANNMVLTSISLIRTFEYVTTCNADFQFIRTTATLNGTGENYFGGITQEGLIIHIDP